MNGNRLSFLLRIAVLAMAVAAFATPALALGTPAGTPIQNQATVDYQDTNGNPLQALSEVVTTTVSQVVAVTVSPDNTGSGDPGDVLYYAHTIDNLGNDWDTIDVTAASSLGWTVQLYHDADGSGDLSAGDALLTDSDGDTVPDTGSMQWDTSFDILVEVTIPVGSTGVDVDTTTVTATSTNDDTVNDTATDTTTPIAPALTVTKSVAPLGDQPPGTVLTYTVVITNGGNADAASVVMTDPIPGFTTYQAGTITQDAAARTDGGGDDNADHGVTTGGAITVDVGTLTVGASTTVEFQVQID